MEWTEEFYEEIKEGLNAIKRTEVGMKELKSKMIEVAAVVTLLKGNGTTGFFKRIENLEQIMKKRFDRIVIVMISALALATALKTFFF